MGVPTTEELLSRAYEESVRLHAEIEQLKLQNLAVRVIADEATELLCTIGAFGLDRSKEGELWDRALSLKAKLDPEGPSARFLAEHGSVQEYRTSKGEGR